jgi:hypothetical protein
MTHVGGGRVLAVAARPQVHGDPLALDEGLHGAGGEPHLHLATREAVGNFVGIPTSSSSSRLTAGASGFLNFRQSRDRPLMQVARAVRWGHRQRNKAHVAAIMEITPIPIAT